MKKQLNEDKERCPICKSYDHVNYDDTSGECDKEMKHKSLSDKRKEILEKVFSVYKFDFNLPVKNVKEIHETTDLLDFIIREVEKQDKQSVKELQEWFPYVEKEVPSLNVKQNNYNKWVCGIINKIFGPDLCEEEPTQEELEKDKIESKSLELCEDKGDGE